MILRSLCGDNPFHFLTAIGTVNILDRLEPKSEWKMRWENNHPEIKSSSKQEPSEKEMAHILAEYVSKEDILFEQECGKRDDSIEKYSEFVSFVMEKNDRRQYDFVACIGFPDMGKQNEGREVKKTMFKFVTGNATLFGNAKKLVDAIKKDKEKIHNTLFKEWEYEEQKMSMDWDPISLKREYATFPSDPSKSFNPTMHGANRLAIEAISLYPTIHDGKSIRTMGWHGKKFVWPIWDGFADMNEIRGMLSIDYRSLKGLDRMGIELYYSEKIKITDRGHARFTSGCRYTKNQNR